MNKKPQSQRNKEHIKKTGKILLRVDLLARYKTVIEKIKKTEGLANFIRRKLDEHEKENQL